MPMYLMDSRKMLNILLPTLLCQGFLGFLFLFTLLYLLVVKKHIFNKFLSQKKTANLTGTKSLRLWRKKGIFFVYVITSTYIIHGIALFIE